MKLISYIPLRRAELAVGTVLFLITLLLIGGYRLSRLAGTQAITAQKPVNIYLHDQKNLDEVAEVLADSGLVESAEELKWAGRLLGWNRFLPGHYRVEGGHSFDALLSRMAKGLQDPVSVTIAPGISRDRFIHSFSSAFRFDSLALARTLEDSTFLRKNEITSHQLTGRLLPDTYSIYWTAPPDRAVERVLAEFRKRVIEPNRERLDELNRSIDEIVTLASIIEWESGKQEEKPRVAGLYWNRLRKNMLLQADPTVNFALGERRRLLYEDYLFEHPYNTYLNRGLPPGPITNPDMASIQAALYPEDHDYLFMVANPEGSHVFTETFEEHKEESEKWRRWIREQHRIKRQLEQEAAENS